MYMGKKHTSQFSRIKQRPPATDLSGPKASAESLTPLRSSLAEANAVDFQVDFLFAAAPSSAVSEEMIRRGGQDKIVHVLSASPLSRGGGDGGDEWTLCGSLWPSLAGQSLNRTCDGSVPVLLPSPP